MPKIHPIKKTHNHPPSQEPRCFPVSGAHGFYSTIFFPPFRMFVHVFFRAESSMDWFAILLHFGLPNFFDACCTMLLQVTVMLLFQEGIYLPEACGPDGKPRHHRGWADTLPDARRRPTRPDAHPGPFLGHIVPFNTYRWRPGSWSSFGEQSLKTRQRFWCVVCSWLCFFLF